MKVALYRHHHYLPFWQRPSNPYALFVPAVLEDWTCVGGIDGRRVFPAKNERIMHVLNGLLALDILGIMAHVSYIIDTEHKIIECPKRCWVQITTEAKRQGEDGLPVVVEDGVVQVRQLWGGDNGTYSPYGFLREELDEHLAPTFWTKFFLQKLQEAKTIACQHAEMTAREAEEVRQLYETIHS